METITIKLNKIKPNPFKKFINDGKLDEEVISKLMEGYKQTTFHVNFKARNNSNNDVELIYGHHRLEAAKRFLGNNHEIKLDVYSNEEFNDEKMLLDMVRENMTQRGEDYRDMADCIKLAKKWLEGNRTVKQLDSSKQTHKTEISSRDIANFLSNQGRSLSHSQVQKHMLIETKLDPELKKKVEMGTAGGKVADNKIGLEVASYLSEFDKPEQKMLYKKIEKLGVNRVKARELLSEFKNASKEIKAEVKRGKVELKDVHIEKFKEKIKEKAEKIKKSKKGKEELQIKELQKFMREGENLIGATNAEILKTCIFFEGLVKTGLIHKLDWNKIYSQLETAQKGGNQYSKFIKKIMEKL